MRKFPGFGRVATESDFKEIEARAQEQFEAFEEASNHLIKRRLEDAQWGDISSGSADGLSDQSPKKRREIVKRAAYYWLNDPLIGSAIDLFNDYVFGEGMGQPRFINQDAQAVVGEFWNHPANKLVLTTTDAQRMKNTELQIQGNVWLTLFVDEATGDVTMSDLIDEEVKDVVVHPENRKMHLFYRQEVHPVKYDFKNHKYMSNAMADPQVRYYADWENYPLPEDDKYASMKPAQGDLADGVVFHISINRLSDGKFGNPYVQRVLDWAHAYNQFMRARVSLMEAAAWLAWKRKVNGDPNKIRRQAQNFVDNRFAQAGSVGAGGVPAPPPPRFAAMITENENSTMEFVKTDTGSANARNDGNMLKSQFGAGIGIPIHYFGDVSSNGATLATATAMDTPVRKRMEALQQLWEDRFSSIIDFVIIQKIKAGILPRPSRGKFADVDGDGVVEAKGSARSHMGDAFVESLRDSSHYSSEQFREDDSGKFDIDLQDVSGNDLYWYDLSLPAILQRQIAETINAVVNIIQTIDPNGTNDELARWALEYSLQTLNVSNVPGVLERIAPVGKPLNRQKPQNQVTVVDGKEYTRKDKDDLGVQNGLGRKPRREERDGDAPTRAWTVEDHASADKTKEGDVNPIIEEIQREFVEMQQSIYNSLSDDVLIGKADDDNA